MIKLTLDEFLEQGHAFGGGEEPVVADPPQSVVNTDGSFTENWFEKYGEENQAHLSRYKDLDSLVNSHIATKKKFGRNPDTLVEIPTETSSDEIKAAFKKAKGVPDSIDSYEYTLSDDFATKLGPVDDKKMAAFREFAHKQEWNPTQFKDALDFYHTNIASDIDTSKITFDEKQLELETEGKAELKKKWLGEYDNKVLRANAVMRKYGGEEAVAEFNAQNSPRMAEFLDNIAEAMSEDTLKGLGPTTGVTADGIKTQLADIYTEMDKIVKENPINFKINSKYKELTERKHELYKQKKASV